MGEIRFVGAGETRGYPYLVCKKSLSKIILIKDILFVDLILSGLMVIFSPLSESYLQ